MGAPAPGRRAWRPGWAFPASLAAAAVLLLAARLFTCVVTLPDDATAILALKRHPSLATTVRLGEEPIRRAYVPLDDDENQLAYEPAYLALMAAAPAVAAALLLAAVLAVVAPRVTARDRGGA